jgi:uncharacterized membrane protein
VAASRKRKSFLLRGLITVLPAALTILLLVVVVQFVNRYVTSPVNSVIYWSLERNALGWNVLRTMDVEPTAIDYLEVDALPPELQERARREGLLEPEFRRALASWREDRLGLLRDLGDLAVDKEKLRVSVTDRVHPLVGVVVSLLLLLIIGYLASGFLGRRIVASLDRTLQSLPVFRSVHPYTKQFVEFFLSDSKLEFEHVVAFEFFNKGVWSLGLVTGKGLRSLNEKKLGDGLSIFIPSSPMPMTGFTVFVPAAGVVPLSITVDDAIRIVVSGGVLVPSAENVEDLEQNLADAGRRLEENAP